MTLASRAPSSVRGSRRREDPGTPSLDAEAMQQILALLRVGREAGSVDDGSMLDPAVLESDRWVRATLEHGVAPLVRRALLARSESVACTRAASALMAGVREAAVHTAALVGELEPLHAELSRCGVPALSFKGPVLAVQLYGDPALRPAADLDLLVPRRSLLDARRSLALLGYAPAPVLGLGSSHPRFGHHVLLEREGSRVKVELHWRMSSFSWREPVSFDQLWRRRIEVEVARVRVPTLCPADLLPALALHGAKHHWSRLIWIMDVALLVRDWSPESWEVSLRRARDLGLARIVAVSVLLASRLLRLELPAPTLRALERDQVATRVAAGCSDDYPRGAARVAAGADELALLLRERARDRWGHLFRQAAKLAIVAFTPSARDEEFLPARLRYRPLRVLGRPLRILVQGRARKRFRLFPGARYLFPKLDLPTRTVRRQDRSEPSLATRESGSGPA
jgi:putative nucleotidyltransferase-like protein